MAGVLSLPLSKVFYGCFSLALSCWKVLQVKVLLALQWRSNLPAVAMHLLKKKNSMPVLLLKSMKELEKSVHFRSPWRNWAGPEGAVKAAR